uniref:Peptidase S1 domain-containing protein n=1 Tax=Panagrolaimus superbus TaxID=310955 RepID=A0A914YG93_9BILA
MLEKVLLLLFFGFKFLLFGGAGKVEVNCGIEFKPNLNSQIIFGTDLKEFEHPWFCDFNNIFEGNESHCSAVLISSEYILTAAHCFDESKVPQHERFTKLRCGSVRNRIDVAALKVIKHSVFADSQMHDLALIKIKEIRYTEYLRPICLISYEKIFENSPVTVVGSGLEFSELSKDAKKAGIIVKSLKICSNLYKHWARSKENVLCAGTFLTGIKGGDSGGPLMASFQGRYYLIGITSAAADRNFYQTFRQDEYPVLFSRIAPECDAFIGNNSNVKCLLNVIPLRASESKETLCGEVSESRRQHFSADNENDAMLQPWFCKLIDTDKNCTTFCGGTLISFRHLLTAQSCLEGIQAAKITVKCGIKFQTTSKILKIRIPDKVIDFNSDLAVIEFVKEITFDGNVGIACLTKTEMDEISSFTVIDQKTRNPKRSLPTVLQNIVTCQKRYSKPFY